MNEDFFGNISDTISAHAKETMIAIAVVGILGAGGYYYINQKKEAEQHAQLDFAAVLSELKKGGADAWEDIEFATKSGLSKHKRSSLGSYFHAVHADALLEQGKKEEALTQLQELMKVIPASSPFYYIFAIKTALVQLSIDAQVAQGVQALEDLAHNAKNLQRDEALYYLGVHYAATGDHAKSRGVFKELIDDFGHADKFGASPWAELAQQKIG